MSITTYRRLAMLAAAASLLAAGMPLAPAAAASPASVTGKAHGTITGRVTDAKGLPLKGICVQVLGVTKLPFPSTSASGLFRVSAPPGHYRVYFQTGCGNKDSWLQHWYTNGKFPYKPAPVTVTARNTTSGINARLVLGGTVAGQVTGPSGRTLSGICVTLLQPHSRYVPSPNVSNNFLITSGKPFALVGVAAGRYKVQFTITTCGTTGNYSNQYWHSRLKISRAAVITVRPGKVVSGIDQGLPVGATITGRVTGTGGVPLGGVCVELSERGWYPDILDVVSTGANGYYRAPALTTGKYYVYFDDPECGGPVTGYQGQAYPTLVPVTNGKVTKGIDASLVPGSS